MTKQQRRRAEDKCFSSRAAILSRTRFVQRVGYIRESNPLQIPPTALGVSLSSSSHNFSHAASHCHSNRLHVIYPVRKKVQSDMSLRLLLLRRLLYSPYRQFMHKSTSMPSQSVRVICCVYIVLVLFARNFTHTKRLHHFQVVRSSAPDSAGS